MFGILSIMPLIPGYPCLIPGYPALSLAIPALSLSITALLSFFGTFRIFINVGSEYD